MTKMPYTAPAVLCVVSSDLMAEGPVTVISGVVDDTNDAPRFDADALTPNTSFGEPTPWE